MGTAHEWCFKVVRMVLDVVCLFCLWNKRVYSLHPGFADVWGVDNLWDISWTCIPLKGQQWTCQFLNEIFNWKAEKYIEKLSCFAEDWRQRPMVPARRGSVLDAAASTRWAFLFFSLWVFEDLLVFWLLKIGWSRGRSQVKGSFVSHAGPGWVRIVFFVAPVLPVILHFD